MAILTDIPNEVMDLILKDVPFRDLEAFFLVSKAIWKQLSALRKKHYHKKRIYTNFQYNQGMPRGKPAKLLKDILLDPSIAKYVVKMDIDCWESGFHDIASHDSSGSDPEYLPYTKSDLQLFEGAIKDNVYHDDEEQKDDMLQDLELGDEQPIIATLLTLLPNIQHLRLVNEVFQNMVHTMRDFVEKRHSDVLTRLQSVHLQASELDGDYVAGFRFTDDQPQLLRLLCSLPSLKSISVQNFSGGASHVISDPIWHPYSYCKIPLTSMRFSNCEIRPETLADLLLRCDNLTTFEYSRGPFSPIDSHRALDLFEICTALYSQCRRTLKTFSMLSNQWPQNFIGSLKSFTLLEDVTADFLLLRPRQGQQLFSEMLPSSIRRLKLHIHNFQFPDDISLQELMLEVIHAKHDELPLLETVEFHDRKGMTPSEVVFGGDGEVKMMGAFQQDLAPDEVQSLISASRIKRQWTGSRGITKSRLLPPDSTPDSGAKK